MRKENGKVGSMRNGYHLYACVVVSRNEGCMAERVGFYTEKRNDIYIAYYVISKKHIEKLEKIGIGLGGSGCHHFVPQTLSSEAKHSIKNSCDKTQINKLKAIAAEMDFDLVISMPKFMHQNNNKVFAGDFTPEEVLKKLDWILDPKRKFTNGGKIDIIDMFAMVSIFSGKDVECGLDPEKVLSMKENDEDVVPNDLLKVFNIGKENIIKYLETFFFYPGYENYIKHFKLLSELRSGDRVRKTRVGIFLNYIPVPS